MTLLHLDHTSGISEFPNSTFAVPETECQAASHGVNPMAEDYRHSNFDYRTVDFHRDNVDSYPTFGRTFDLFGDGSEPPPPRPQDAYNARQSLQEMRLFRSQFPGRGGHARSCCGFLSANRTGVPITTP